MTNYIGVAMAINAISRQMVAVNAGVIICLSSVAGERGRQKNFIYGASKSALTTYLQGLRMKVYRHGVRVITVVPGYVDTLMSYGKVNRFFAVSPRYVAHRIYNLLGCRKDVVYLPPIWWLIMKLIGLIPETLFKRISSDF
jgi:short-subunit dehydrogenase